MGAISSSRGFSWLRDQTHISCTAGRFFTNWATTEADSVIHIYIYVSISIVVDYWMLNINPCATQFSSVQSLSRVWLFVTPRAAAHQASRSITNSQSLLKLMSVMPSNNLILCHPLLLPSIFSSIRVFSNESALRIRWPKHWSFSFNVSPSNEYSGLTSFRIDWLYLLAVQGTLKSLFQHHSSKASTLQCSAFL